MRVEEYLCFYPILSECERSKNEKSINLINQSINQSLCLFQPRTETHRKTKSEQKKNEKTLRETQTLCAGCKLSKGGAKNFRPVTDLLPEGAGWPKFNQMEIIV